MGSFTKKLKQSGRRAHEAEVSVFPAKQCCHDCAFRQGSPERADPKRWAEIEALARGFQPFYCHIAHDGTEMPTGDDGEYQPKIVDGRPKGFPMCAGWATMFDKEAREFNARAQREDTCP